MSLEYFFAKICLDKTLGYLVSYFFLNLYSSVYIYIIIPVIIYVSRMTNSCYLLWSLSIISQTGFNWCCNISVHDFRESTKYMQF